MPHVPRPRPVHLAALVALAVCNGVLPAAEVLVIGGTGQLGSQVVAQLLARGDAVSVFVRPDSDRSALPGTRIRFIEGDLLEGDTIRAAFDGRRFDYVVNAVARRPGEPSPYVVSEPVTTAAAMAAGVSQYVYFSAVGAGDSKTVIPARFYTQFAETYLDRERSEAVIVASGVPYTIIRLGVVHEGEATGKARLERTPVLGPVTRADAAALAVNCLGDASCVGLALHAIDPSLPLMPGAR